MRDHWLHCWTEIKPWAEVSSLISIKKNHSELSNILLFGRKVWVEKYQESLSLKKELLKITQISILIKVLIKTIRVTPMFSFCLYINVTMLRKEKAAEGALWKGCVR